MRRGGGRGGGGGGGGGGRGGYYSSDSTVGNSNPHGGYAASLSPPQMLQNKPDNHPGHSQWRWERDASKAHSPMSPNMLSEGQGSEASRVYLQGHRPDSRMAHGKQDSHDMSRGEVADAADDRNPVSHSFDEIEKKFLDDIMKLSKEQSDAEDAELARHREKINAINGKYEEEVASVRAKHGSRREELLQRESHSRWQQYQQAMSDNFHGPSSFGGPNDPLPRSFYPAADTGYNSYSGDRENDRDRERFLASARNHELESRGHYSGGRMHDTAPHYY